MIYELFLGWGVFWAAVLAALVGVYRQEVWLSIKTTLEEFGVNFERKQK